MLLEVGRHLLFFDKDGNELNLTRTYGVWYGMLYFPRVSSSLHEVQHVFVTEEVKYEQVFTQSINVSSLPIGYASSMIVYLSPDPTDTNGSSKVYKQGSFINLVSSDQEATITATIHGYDANSGQLDVRVVSKTGTGTYSSWKAYSIIHTYPRGDNNSYFSFSWREVESMDNIFLFETDISGEYPVIRKLEKADVLLDDGTSDDIEGVTFSGNIPIAVDPNASLYRIISDGNDIDTRVMQANIALYSEEESRHARTLEIYYNNLAPKEEKKISSFTSAGTNNQKYSIDVNEAFDENLYSFDVSVAVANQGKLLTSDSDLTLGSMSLVFSSSISNKRYSRLQEGGVIFVVNKSIPSEIYLCNVVYSDYNPSTHETTVYIEDNDALSLVSNVTNYKILFSDSDIIDVTIVKDKTVFSGDSPTVVMKRDTATTISFLFGPSGGTFIPSANSNLVVSYLPIENSQKVAEIAVYGEVEGEDERYRILLENMGRDIVSDVGPIFRQSDVYESLPDYTIVNNKRKELLAAGEEIFPYMGSYKAFINAIKFFGYGDLRLKEYWKNIDVQSNLYGKYRHVDIPLDLRTKTDDNLAPSQSWKKTNRFSLFYDINRLTGASDEYGQPITEDVFDFTNDEVLIKLFSLKNALKKYFLPLNARIVDITGEGIYFDTYAFETWLTQNEIITASPDSLDIKFSVIPEIAYLEDLGNNLKTDDPLIDGATIRDAAEYSISDFANYELRSFFVNKSTSRFLDDAQVNVGATVTLKAETFTITWGDLKSKWSSMKSAYSNTLSSGQYSWGGISKGDIYEMEWRVKSTARIQDFAYSIRGKVADLQNHDVTVPYEGRYNVTLAYHLTSSGSQSKTKVSAFEVFMKSSNIVGIYKGSNLVKSWGDLQSSWGLSSYQWSLPNRGILRPVRRRRLQNPTDDPMLFKRTTWQQSKSRWDDLSASRYINTPELLGVVNVPISSLDKAEKTIRLSGNYYNPDIPIDSTISVGTFLKFLGPVSREGYDVLEYDSIQKVISVRGEHAPSSLENNFVSVISRKTYDNLTFTALTNNLETQGYRPVYSFQISGDVTGKIRNGSSIEYKLQNQTEYNESIVKSCAYILSSNITRVVIQSMDERTFNFDVSERDDNAHITQLVGCSIRYFDFSTRLTPSSVLPYNGRTMIFFSDPLNTLADIPNPSISGNEVLAYWANVSESAFLPVIKVSYDGTDTVIRVDDPENRLSQIDTTYSVEFSGFDIDYAEQWFGVDALSTWASVTSNWSSAFSRTWGSTEFHGDVICGYILKSISPGGTIIIDSGETFEFPNNEFLTLGEAVQSLQESKISGISKFNYSVALYDETLGLVRTLPYSISIEETDSYDSYDIGATYFIVPLESVNEEITISATKAAKVVYLGDNGSSNPVFRVLSVGSVDIHGNYTGRKLGSVALNQCFGSNTSIVEPISAGKSNYDGKISDVVVATFDGNDPQMDYTFVSPEYGYWPYYTPSGFVFKDGYFLDTESNQSSVNPTVCFSFNADISNLPCFDVGSEFYIKNSDGTETIELTIADSAYYDATKSLMIVPVEVSPSYSAVGDVTDFRSFFIEWSEITNPISYDISESKDIYTEPTFVILASAKLSGTSGLCYMEYGGGVYGSDSEFPTRGNSFPLFDWRELRLTDDFGSYNPLDYAPMRAWQEGGFSYPPVKNLDSCSPSLPRILRSKYGAYLNGTFTWSDTYIGYDHVDAPTLSTICFTLGNCQIAGATDVIWTLTDSNSGVDLVKCQGRNFTWTFKDVGDYDVKANVIDVNNNTQEISKIGFVRVFDSYEKLQYEGCPID